MAETTQTTHSGRPKPPMPEFLFKLANPVMKAVLRSPLHGALSKRLMVLTFTGRKTGKRYSTPVGYTRDGQSIYVFTHSAWRKNFTQAAPASMRIEGKNYSGIGQLVSDPERVRTMLRTMIAASGEEMARRMNFWVDQLESASPQQIQDATRGTYFLEIRLNPVQQ